MVGSSQLVGRSAVKLKDITRGKSPPEFKVPLGKGEWANPGGPVSSAGVLRAVGGR